ncbi:manganese efflux pump [bacterium]|nr:manganese efflux pump [bacterium]
MNIIELIVLSFSLSMDSFATSLCKGIEFNNNLYKSSITTSIWFSIFQTIMPILGYYLGNIISMKLFSVAYYISFFILSFLGISMIREKDDVVQLNDSLGFKIMFLLSVSISMDAFSVGISYALLNLNIILSSILNFSITFITTYIGCILGSKIGSKYSSISKTIGGIILISLGIKILLTHIL